MTNDERNPHPKMTKQLLKQPHRPSDFAGHAVAARRRVTPSSLVIGRSSLRSRLIATDVQLTALLAKIDAAGRVAIDIEADSLHSYREKLCLLQISVPTVAGIDDAGPDVETGSGTQDQRSRLQHDVIVDQFFHRLERRKRCHRFAEHQHAFPFIGMIKQLLASRSRE